MHQSGECHKYWRLLFFFNNIREYFFMQFMLFYFAGSDGSIEIAMLTLDINIIRMEKNPNGVENLNFFLLFFSQFH